MKIKPTQDLFLQIQIKKGFINFFELCGEYNFITATVISGLCLANLTLVLAEMKVNFFGFHIAMS